MVTVILTVFKRTRYLAAAIRSVLQQTFEDIELIVTDDADSVAARQICEGFAEDKRLRYRANDVNVGTPLNVAAALREARGQYVAILNDDDLLYPRMLQQLIQPLTDHPQAVAAFANHDVMNADGQVLTQASRDLMAGRGRDDLLPGLIQDSLSFTVRGGLMVVMGCVFRKSAIDPAWLVKEVGGAYDYWLAIKLSERGALFFVPETVMAWRQHSDSVTATGTPDVYVGAIYICERLLAGSLKSPTAGYARDRLAGFLFKRAQVYLERGWNLPDARHFLYQSWTTKWSFLVFRCWFSTFVPKRASRRHTILSKPSDSARHSGIKQNDYPL